MTNAIMLAPVTGPSTTTLNSLHNFPAEAISNYQQSSAFNCPSLPSSGHHRQLDNDDNSNNDETTETFSRCYNENSTSNNSEEPVTASDDLFETSEKALFSLVLVSMIAVGLFGNGLTIATVLQRRFRLRTPANYFVLNLAIADFAISVFSNSTHLANVWSSFMKSNAQVCRFLATLSLLGCCESFFTITAIAIFRFLGVRFSLQGLGRRRHVAFTLIGLTWLVSVAFAVSNAVVETGSLYSPSVMTCLYKFRETSMATLTLFLMIACLVIVTATYFSLIARLVANEQEQRRCFSSLDKLPDSASPSNKTKPTQSAFSFAECKQGLNNNKRLLSASSLPAVFQHRQQHRGSNTPSTISSYNRLSLSKTVKTVIFLVILIYVFWIPTLAIQGLSRGSTFGIPNRMSMFALLLAHCNSSVNFVVYAVFSKFFRGALVDFVCSLVKCSKVKNDRQPRLYSQNQPRRNKPNRRQAAAMIAMKFPIVDLPCSRRAENDNNEISFYVGSPSEHRETPPAASKKADDENVAESLLIADCQQQAIMKQECNNEPEL